MINKDNITIKVSTISYINNDEVYPGITTYNADIILNNFEESSSIKIGTLELFLIDFLVEEDAFLTLDYISGLDVYCSIIDELSLKLEYENIGNEFNNIDEVLILNNIKINEKYRGNKIAKDTIIRTIKSVNLHRLNILLFVNPYPLQYENNVNDKNKEDFEKAKNILQCYYTKIGFLATQEDKNIMFTTVSNFIGDYQ